MAYMESTHPDAFKDMVKKKDPSILWFKNVPMVECPVCQGYGGWNLRLNSYRDGSHFQCGCSQCNGWGWVDSRSTDATCTHTWSRVTIGHCLHRETCSKCGKEVTIDSSG